MARRKLPPDTRLDWRDPNMPVFRTHRERGLIQIPIELENKRAQHSLVFSSEPEYDIDPTYNLRRKPKT